MPLLLFYFLEWANGVAFRATVSACFCRITVLGNLL
jgi:hypothetical protein